MTVHPALAAAARYTRTALADLLESDDMSVRVRRGAEHLRDHLDGVSERTATPAPRGWLAAAAHSAIAEDGETVHTLVAALAAAVRPRDVEEPPAAAAAQPAATEPSRAGDGVVAVEPTARQARAVPPATARLLIAASAEDARATSRAGHRWPSTSLLAGDPLPSWVYTTDSPIYPNRRAVLHFAGRGARGNPLLAGPKGGALEVCVTEAANKALGWHSGRHVMADDVAVVAEAAGLDRTRVRFRLLG